MKSWKARMLVGFMLVAMMLATIAGPALANDGKNDNDNNHHNGFNIFDDNDNHHNDDFDFVNFDNNDDFDHNDDFDDDDFDFDNNDVVFTPFLFAIDDIDCDGVDDDFDGGIDEDALVCVVEFD
jgi:hypothetical protein